MSEKKILEMKGDGQPLSFQEIRDRVLAYENELRAYLVDREATIENYKFSVEKETDGLVVDVAFRARIHHSKAGISK